jgi:hypothetical protein
MPAPLAQILHGRTNVLQSPRAFFQQNTKHKTNAGKQSKGTDDKQKRKAGAKNAVIMHYSLHVAELHVLSNISGRRLEVILGSPDTS